MAGKFALLIGVGHYDAGLPPIPSALRDVEALAEVLRDPDLGQFQTEAVRVMKDPTRTNMEDAVEALFANRDPDDLLLLYFSGHGLRDERRQLFLACNETARVQEGPNRGRLRQATALPARTVQDYMQASPSRHQLVILDCCFSGAMAIGMTVKDDGIIDIADALGGEGRAVLTSSASTELSLAGNSQESESSVNEEGLSAYTRFLVEGIRTGAADSHGRGYVDAEDLHDYVKRRLAELNPAQTPMFFPTQTGFRIRVSRVRRDPTVTYRMKVQKLVEGRRGIISPAGRLLLDDLRQELDLSLAVGMQIEAEVLDPFSEYKNKLDCYEKALNDMRATLSNGHQPLSAHDWNELKELGARFKLLPSDVEQIHKRLAIIHDCEPADHDYNAVSSKKPVVSANQALGAQSYKPATKEGMECNLQNRHEELHESSNDSKQRKSPSNSERRSQKSIPGAALQWAFVITAAWTMPGLNWFSIPIMIYLLDSQTMPRPSIGFPLMPWFFYGLTLAASTIFLQQNDAFMVALCSFPFGLYVGIQYARSQRQK